MTNPDEERKQHPAADTGDNDGVEREELSGLDDASLVDSEKLHFDETVMAQPDSSGDDLDFDLDESELGVSDDIDPDNQSTLINPVSQEEITDTTPHDTEQESIPGFEVVEELGRGAFGVVFRAIDRNLDRQVAIKLPVLKNADLSEKYLQEARNAAQIDAAGIVPVYQVGTTDSGHPFVVQKLINGSTLQELLKESESLPATWVVEMVRKLADAIGIAHQTGLVHRDLKPANILIDQAGEPWIADFGLSVFEEDQSRLRGEVAGTPIYMAPEQLSGRADWLDGRSDIWALGIILYESLIGKAPFSGENLRSLKEQILERDPKPLCQRIPELPAELDQVFSRCCAKKVNDRYPNAQELAADLQRILHAGCLPADDTHRASSFDGAATIRSRTFSNTVLGRTGVGANTIVQPARPAAGNPTRWPIALAVTAGALGLIALLVNLYWPSSTNGDPNPNQSNDSLAASGVASDQGSLANEMERARPTETRWLVSPGAADAYRSIAEALAEAPAGARIEIEPGIYREEGLLLSKDVELFGMGSSNEVQIIGSGTAACEIDQAAKCILTNLSLAASGQDLNTIELRSGELHIKDCEIRSTGFDCVKAHPNTTLSVSNSRLITARHPAIIGLAGVQMEVRKTDFRFELVEAGIEREDPVAGIELTECRAEIFDCNFTGAPGVGKGISARDCTDALRIVGTKFTSLQHGLELFGCQEVDVESQSTFSQCELAIYADASTISMNDSVVSKCDYGLSLLASSTLEAINLSVRETKAVGIWLAESTAALRQSTVIENETLGVLVDCQELAEGGLVAEQTEFQSNQIGILLAGGRLELTGGLVSGNLRAGVAVLAPSQVPAAMRRASETAAEQEPESRYLVADQTTLNARPEAPAILFNATGIYELRDCVLVDRANHNLPALSGGLTTSVQGTQTRVIPRSDL